MSAFRLRWLAAAALFGVWAMGAVGACGGDKFTLIAGDDGGASDSGVGDDSAPSDAGTTDAESPSYCAMMSNVNHFLCDDFDIGSDDMPLNDKLWDAFSASPTGDGRINNAKAFSRPRSLSVFSLMASPGTETFALLEKNLQHAKTVQVAFQVMVEAYGGDGTAADATALLSIGFGPVSYTLVAVAPNDMQLVETLTADAGTKQSMSHPAPAGLGTNMWVGVQVQLTLPQLASSGSFSIVVGTIGAGGTLTYPTGASPTGTLLLGFLLENSTSIWRIRYDNVVIDKTN